MPEKKGVIQADTIVDIQKDVRGIHISNEMAKYIAELVAATRNPEMIGLTGLKRYIELGGSPRATLGIGQLSRAKAYLDERDYITPKDVESVWHMGMRHRLQLSFAAEADGISIENVLDKILRETTLP